MNKKPAIAVLYHLFYEDSCETVCNELKPLLEHAPLLLFNICTETPGKKMMGHSLKRNFPGCFVIFTSNTGKDIGAKLALFELLEQLERPVDYILLLHDKKSLQALKSASWKNDLLKIISPENLGDILECLWSNHTIGIIATKEYIISEAFVNNQFTGMNGPLLSGLLNTYGIHPASYEFVGGTMFWARATPLLNFFKQHNPLVIRSQLERGNVLDNFSGTITHSWERLLSWIITAQGYKINGI